MSLRKRARGLELYLCLVLGMTLDRAEFVRPVRELALVAIAAGSSFLPGAAQFGLHFKNRPSVFAFITRPCHVRLLIPAFAISMKITACIAVLPVLSLSMHLIALTTNVCQMQCQ